QALLGEVDPRYADAEPPVARPQGPHRRRQSRGLAGRQALSRAHAARAGLRPRRPVVEGGQPRLLRRLHRDAGQLMRAVALALGSMLGLVGLGGTALAETEWCPDLKRLIDL